MQLSELAIPGAWQVVPKQFADDRGVFLEWFKDPAFVEATGRRLDLQQANASASAAGVVRGIHFADVPPGQAKYVTCVRGSVIDVIVDIRVGSPTFGQWQAVPLDDADRHAVFLSEGLGHGFMALTPDATVIYLCSSTYAPGREHGINPLDPDLGIEWPTQDASGAALEPLLSSKDTEAPGLHEAAAQGLLPTWEQTQEFIRSLG